MKYLRRGTGWLAGILLITAILIGLVIVTFNEAMNLTNIQIVLKGGMAYRAQALMGISDGSERSTFFTDDATYGDDAEDIRQRYEAYNIRGINHNLDTGFAWIWPQWGRQTEAQTVTIEVTESIPSIDGRARGSRAEELVQEGGADAVYPPKWITTRYRVTLERDTATRTWRIKKIERN